VALLLSERPPVSVRPCCSKVLFDATTGQQTTLWRKDGQLCHFGTVLSPTVRLSKQQLKEKEQESTLRVVTSNWQVEAELFTCQGQSRPVTTGIDGNGSTLQQQDYCYDAATCTVESTC
jgi:hypothetical protein